METENRPLSPTSGGEMMLRPSQVAFYAKKAEGNNYRFRTWLKGHADGDDLDSRFLRLHEELFAQYDCRRCRNCCKKCVGSVPADEIAADAAYLDMTESEFLEKYFREEPDYEEGKAYTTKHVPCDFLNPDNSCMLGDHMPQNCRDFPYTNRKDRMASLLSFLDAVAICPVAYEICVRLKKEYGFR